MNQHTCPTIPVPPLRSHHPHHHVDPGSTVLEVLAGAAAGAAAGAIAGPVGAMAGAVLGVMAGGVTAYATQQDEPEAIDGPSSVDLDRGGVTQDWSALLAELGSRPPPALG